jgi:hypothetical protein
MKNVQIIDAALNCAFSTFDAKDEESALLFLAPGAGNPIH